MNKVQEQVKFTEFVSLANFFFRTVGVYAYDNLDGSKQETSRRDTILFFGSFMNLFILYGLMLVFVVKSISDPEQLATVTMAMAYISAGVVAVIKTMAIVWHRPKLTKFMRTLHTIFPTTLESQEQYEVRKYWRLNRRVTRGLTFIFLTLIFAFNLDELKNWLIYGVWLKKEDYEQLLPYAIWTPFDWHGNWTYYLMYFLLSVVGFNVTTTILSSDLLLYASITQMIMHFDHVARSLTTYKTQDKGTDPQNNAMAEQRLRKDLHFIGGIIEHHDKILKLTDDMNEVFGIALLINIFTTSFLICFVVFQMTIGNADTAIMYKFVLSLSAWMSQVYFISLFGQKLMDASTSIASAAYNQNWHGADVRYKKMLVLITQRAQQPAMLKATFLMEISMVTMTDMLQRAYQLFAILRELYSD